MAKGVFSTSLLGLIGMGMVAMAGQNRDARTAQETRLGEVSEKIETLANAPDLDEAQTRRNLRTEAIGRGCRIDCLNIVVITILTVVVGNAASHW